MKFQKIIWKFSEYLKWISRNFSKKCTKILVLIFWKVIFVFYLSDLVNSIREHLCPLEAYTISRRKVILLSFLENLFLCNSYLWYSINIRNNLLYFRDIPRNISKAISRNLAWGTFTNYVDSKGRRGCSWNVNVNLANFI